MVDIMFQQVFWSLLMIRDFIIYCRQVREGWIDRQRDRDEIFIVNFIIIQRCINDDEYIYLGIFIEL